MASERILYPCYFDAGLLRREGRRVSRDLAVAKPDAAQIKAALSRIGVAGTVEDAPYPGRWMHREGRVRVAWDGSKEELLQTVARELQRRA
ncbi:MAG: signal recognition particle protein Srp19 [Methanomicrobiales archaeon]|nr:signal recognition particle protein Srp19 [Methanomicrobiales archaeon]